MSRFQEVSDTIYVGYNQNDLKEYVNSANIKNQCTKNKDIYDGINSEFNPSVVPVFHYGDKITPSQPFYGSNGLSLHLEKNGNVFLQGKEIDASGNHINLWNAGCDGSTFKGSEKGFHLTNQFTCSNGKIIDNTYDIATKSKAIILNPSCDLDQHGNLVCKGCTWATGETIPYMTFLNTSSPGSYTTSNLIINGDYALDNKNNSFRNATGTSMVGNLTILDSSNNIINTSIHLNDSSYLKNKLQSNFDNSEKCNNASSATELISQHNNHLAAEQVKKDSDIAYNIQYINTINLGIGIFITIGYIYFLYKKKT